ncbi:LysE/ArgO family amino acid transporter [Moraxella nasibovis]|uniref:LysE/ArgO family amino acid transporter n=1 Tax=Moraxella nasibovis TaxID=2904120 RepID=UPI00240FF8B6|nr:LysE/ArgO family amino acid transporter [Moraxella nasibovis]WFF39147.1 LysE/ArgO family amino acid transporter [Moraxella nasibovis]
MSSTIIQGFFVSFGLIVAIGAQNAYVLKQGLLKQHIFWVCLVCFLCDFTLLSLGVLGLGSLIGQSKIATLSLAIFGAVFLLWYGFRSFRSAYQGGANLSVDGTRSQATLKQTIATTLALTLLNPHVYLDTLVLVGSIASPLATSEKYQFLIGAVCASALWFFGLGYGARLLIPLFAKPNTWRVLDGFIGVVMWAIAFSLIKYALNIGY